MVDDGFERYFAEKLWEMIPAVYRHEDGLASKPGALRALVEIFAEQAAVLRRSHDRVWEDQFIELCDDWAVPYLGDLVGTRMVSALIPQARRVDVAKTIYYRRRAGTPAVLEELIRDITGWEGTVVEGFRRLGRSRHRLDPAPAPLAGRYTGTAPGGWADLRQPRATQLAGTAFDEFHHTPDLRRPRGKDGRYGIHRIAFHLCRLRAFRVSGVTPYQVTGSQGFTFDPSGRDIPLFMPANRLGDQPLAKDGRAGRTRWRRAREWELPGPLRCRLLNQAEYAIDESLIADLVDRQIVEKAMGEELRRIVGQRFRNETKLGSGLKVLPSGEKLLSDDVYRELSSGALVEDCGKSALLANALRVENQPGKAVSPVDIVAGDLTNWHGAGLGKGLVIDPERGRCLFLDTPTPEKVRVAYHYGFSADIGAGTYDRRSTEQIGPAPEKWLGSGGKIAAHQLSNEGVIGINDSATYGPVAGKKNISNLFLQAANRERPFLRLDRDWLLRGADMNAELVLDGLWIGTTADAKIILRGQFKSVTLRHVTLDPGGKKNDDPKADDVPALSLVIKGMSNG